MNGLGLCTCLLAPPSPYSILPYCRYRNTMACSCLPKLSKITVWRNKYDCGYRLAVEHLSKGSRALCRIPSVVNSGTVLKGLGIGGEGSGDKYTLLLDFWFFFSSSFLFLLKDKNLFVCSSGYPWLPVKTRLVWHLQRCLASPLACWVYTDEHHCTWGFRLCKGHICGLFCFENELERDGSEI